MCHRLCRFGAFYSAKMGQTSCGIQSQFLFGNYPFGMYIRAFKQNRHIPSSEKSTKYKAVLLTISSSSSSWDCFTSPNELLQTIIILPRLFLRVISTHEISVSRTQEWGNSTDRSEILRTLSKVHETRGADPALEKAKDLGT